MLSGMPATPPTSRGVPDTALIEPMMAPDLDEVLAVESRSFADPWPRNVFEAELRHDWSYSYVLRPSLGASVIGHAVIWIVADEVQLLHIAVDPEWRGRGFGSALMARLFEQARHSKAARITLEVRRSNRAALKLYLSLGFQSVGLRPRYYASDGEDAIVMDCVLNDESE